MTPNDLAALLRATHYGRAGWETAPIVLFDEAMRGFEHTMSRAICDVIEATCGIRRGAAGNTEVEAPTQTWMFLLEQPKDLFTVGVVPQHWLDAQPTKLENGLTWPGGMPRNLWLGTILRAGGEQAVEDLLEARVAERFLVRLRGVEPAETRPLCNSYLGDDDATNPQLTCVRTKGHEGLCDNIRGDFDVAKILEAWRCRICGERGRAPRPDRCRRWKMLCSEGTIVPLIGRVFDEVGDLEKVAWSNQVAWLGG